MAFPYLKGGPEELIPSGKALNYLRRSWDLILFLLGLRLKAQVKFLSFPPLPSLPHSVTPPFPFVLPEPLLRS